MTLDLILRGGHVIDPSQNIDAVMDVGFRDGKAAGVAKTLKAGPKTEIRDVKGYIVTPGLIDAYGRLGIVEIDAEEGSVDTGAKNLPYSAAFSIAAAALAARRVAMCSSSEVNSAPPTFSVR